MAEEGKGVAMAILGIVAVIAVVGLVLLFTGATGQGVYGGGEIRRGLNEQTSGVERYIDDTRILEFEEGYDPYHPRLRDSGDRDAPYAIVSSPHREWSDQRDDPCPPDYPDKTTQSRGVGRECIYSETETYEGFLCCKSGLDT